MNKTLSILLKVVGGIVGLLLVLLLVVAVLLNTHSVQNKILDVATKRLEEKLQTRVRIDNVSVNVLTQEISLKGLEVEDQAQRKMLELDVLSVSLNLRDLLAKRLTISKADIEGVRAKLYKPEGGPANYQFVIDAFKGDKPVRNDSVQQDTTVRKREPFKLDIRHVRLTGIDVQYNENRVTLGEIGYDKGWLGSPTGQLRQVEGRWELLTKKGPQTAMFSLGDASYSEQDGKHDVAIGGLHFSLDNHQPRKNTGKPNRGWFDVGHLDVAADLKMTIDYLSKDSVHARLTEFVAKDTLAGFNVKDLRFTVGATRERATLRQVVVQQESTILSFDSASVVLPDKKEGRGFSFRTSRIKGKAVLKDISRPFAPVLKNFKMPLELEVLFRGTDTTLVFDDIKVNTPDRRLKIDAVGGIEHLNKSEEMDIHFLVRKMTAKGTVKQEIIRQFSVKKLMMKQLAALGDITYAGTVRIPYHREVFKGVLGTAVGRLQFDFAIDDNTHYVTGHVDTKSFRLGKALDMKNLGNVGLKGAFKIDIDKRRTAQVRRRNGGGKMPIGTVNATVYEVNYKNTKVKNLLVDIKSNGALVEGDISQQNKGLDWACSFSFTDIDKLSSIKVKPKVKLKVKELFRKKDSSAGKDESGKDSGKKKSIFKKLLKKKGSN